MSGDIKWTKLNGPGMSPDRQMARKFLRQVFECCKSPQEGEGDPFLWQRVWQQVLSHWPHHWRETGGFGDGGVDWVVGLIFDAGLNGFNSPNWFWPSLYSWLWMDCNFPGTAKRAFRGLSLQHTQTGKCWWMRPADLPWWMRPRLAVFDLKSWSLSLRSILCNWTVVQSPK